MIHYPPLHSALADRRAAGRILVEPLLKYRGRADVLVLALPRGGVPVAYELASALQARLDLMLVRKLGVPFHEELAMGAIASGDIQILNEDVLRLRHINQATVETVAARESRELLRREQVYRGTRPAAVLSGQVVILVDDGVATGASMMAAVHAARLHNPARIVVAVPVAPLDTAEALRAEVDELVCPIVLEWMLSIGNWYLDFSQTSDEEVVELLQRAWQREAQPPPDAP